jgi:hypothetical protein
MRHAYNDGSRKTAGFKGMPAIASLGRRHRLWQ